MQKFLVSIGTNPPIFGLAVLKGHTYVLPELSRKKTSCSPTRGGAELTTGVRDEQWTQPWLEEG